MFNLFIIVGALAILIWLVAKANEHSPATIAKLGSKFDMPNEIQGLKNVSLFLKDNVVHETVEEEGVSNTIAFDITVVNNSGKDIEWICFNICNVFMIRPQKIYK